MDQSGTLKLFTEIKSDRKFILAAIILCLSNVFIYKAIFFEPKISVDNFNKDFPSKISTWISEDVHYNKEVLSVLDPDRIVYKTYYDKEKPPITLFMACYNTLEKVDLSHSPIVCFTGQGWEIVKTGKIKIPIELSDPKTININQIIQRKNGQTMITFYWYQSHDRIYHNRGIQKIALFFEKLLGGADKNAFVRLTLLVPQNKSIEEGSFFLNGFFKDFYPVMRKYFN